MSVQEDPGLSPDSNPCADGLLHGRPVRAAAPPAPYGGTRNAISRAMRAPDDDGGVFREQRDSAVMRRLLSGKAVRFRHEKISARPSLLVHDAIHKQAQIAAVRNASAIRKKGIRAVSARRGILQGDSAEISTSTSGAIARKATPRALLQRSCCRATPNRRRLNRLSQFIQIAHFDLHRSGVPGVREGGSVSS